MTKEAEAHLRAWAARNGHRTSKLHGFVRELFEDWERLRKKEHEGEDAWTDHRESTLTSEGVYE